MNPLPPRLFPPVDYFATLIAGGDVDYGLRYNKRDKAVHRYEIIDVRGRMFLTVPLGKPHGIEHPTWADCPVSTHDRWWRRHRTALESAYGRTPFFEFIIDRFNPVFRSPEEWHEWPSIIDLIREANAVVLPLLGIGEMPGVSRNVDGEEYWQVRSHIHGFQSGLSILDLIFNLGPEAALFLRSPDQR